MKLFTKTCKKDFEFLSLAIKTAIYRCDDEIFWTFICDTKEHELLLSIINSAIQKTKKQFNYRIFEVQEYWSDGLAISDGYLIQQWVKMNAHRVMKDSWGGYFMNWDSDVIALRSFSENCFKGLTGKPIFYMTPFNHLIKHFSKVGPKESMVCMIERQHFLKKVMNLKDVPFELMRTAPQCMHSEILEFGSTRPEWNNVRTTLINKQGAGMSEFCIIGIISQLFFPYLYEWRHTEKESFISWKGPVNDPNTIIYQREGWVNLTDEIKNLANF